MESFAVLCPCALCKGEKLQNLKLVGPGLWVCPVSGQNSVTNTTEVGRAQRDFQKETANLRRKK